MRDAWLVLEAYMRIRGKYMPMVSHRPRFLVLLGHREFTPGFWVKEACILRYNNFNDEFGSARAAPFFGTRVVWISEDRAKQIRAWLGPAKTTEYGKFKPPTLEQIMKLPKAGQCSYWVAI